MRLVASDLDGTIVPPDGVISARTVAALQACQDAGVDVVFVTGRPPRWMSTVAQATGHRGEAICGNGALLIDLFDLRVLRARPLAPSVVLGAAHRLRERLPAAAFALETTAGYRREPQYVPRHDAARQAMTGSLADLLDDRPVVAKLLCRVPGGVADELLGVAREVLAGVAEPVHSDPEGDLLEISALGVSKGTALAELAAGRGITADQVVAFGDMPNDVPMLRWAGRGYAMSGGHPEAVAAAALVAPPCEQDGVAQVLEQLLGA